MKRLLFCTLLLLAGCATTAERASVRLLPEDGQPFPYAELLTRARLQAAAGTEAFYVNDWDRLEEAAQALEQTARFLGKSADVPAGLRDKLPVAAGDLGKEAIELREAARTKDIEKTNQIFQRINLKVREMRLEN